MWCHGRRLFTIGLVLFSFSEMAHAGPCTEEGLRAFRKSGAETAFYRFHELIEERRCRSEAGFLVNLAQVYKAHDVDPGNKCRALLAYTDALEQPNLEPPFPRVAATAAGSGSGGIASGGGSPL